MKHEVDHLIDIPTLDLETLVQLTTSSVYALCNTSDKRIQIYGSSTTLVHLGRILEEVKTSGEYKLLKDDLSKVKLVILETNISSESIRLKIGNWIREYKKRGYSLYKDIAPLKYKLDFNLEYKAGRLRYCLYLVNQGSDRKLVGIFDKKKDMKEFMSVHYRGNIVSEIVVHESVTGNSTST